MTVPTVCFKKLASVYYSQITIYDVFSYIVFTRWYLFCSYFKSILKVTDQLSQYLDGYFAHVFISHVSCGAPSNLLAFLCTHFSLKANKWVRAHNWELWVFYSAFCSSHHLPFEKTLAPSVLEDQQSSSSSFSSFLCYKPTQQTSCEDIM